MKLPALLALAVAMPLHALEVPPPPTRHLVDYTGRLEAAGLARAEAALADLAQRHGHQVVAAFFPSLAGEALEDFTVRCAEAWRVGRRGLDDGVILFAFLAERRMRLEVGYGLEGTIPDAVARRILDHTVRPAFARGDYPGGVVALAGALDALFAGGAPPPAPGKPGRPLIGISVLLGILLVMMVLLIVASRLGGLPPPRGGGASPWRRGSLGGWGRYGGISLGGFGGGGGFFPGGGSFGGGGASGSW